MLIGIQAKKKGKDALPLPLFARFVLYKQRAAVLQIKYD
jgi:hypothetical protein